MPPGDLSATLPRMTAARRPVATAADVPAPRVPMIGVLRALLLLEAAGGVALAVYLSIVAGDIGVRDGTSAEEPLRFAAGGAFVFAILAASASRGARRRRPWGWTLAAILQVIVAVATGAAVMATEFHPVFLTGFALAALVMMVLSTTSVRRALGQEDALPRI